MLQQGQVFRLTTVGVQATSLWAYRYRIGGREGKRVQRGGFATEQDARAALEQALEKLRRRGRIGRMPTLAEFVDEYLAQHEASTVTLGKLRFLLDRAVAAFGDYRLDELSPVEIAGWRMTIRLGYRFEATQALRQVLARAVVWGLLDINPAKQGVENPQRRRTEKRPFESWEEIDGGHRTARTALRADGALRRRDRACDQASGSRSSTATSTATSASPTSTAPSAKAGSPARRRRRADAPYRSKPTRSTALDQLPHETRRPALPGRTRRPPRSAQLPQPRLEARPAGGRDRAVPTHLRSPTHVRHLRPPRRHLDVRTLALHGRQPDHDRPPLRPPRPRRTRARDPPPRRPQRRRRWTVVDARWTLEPVELASTPATEDRLKQAILEAL